MTQTQRVPHTNQLKETIMQFNIKLSGEQLSTVLTGLNVLQGNVAATSDAIVAQANEQQPKQPPAPPADETPAA
jgi:hypothetical protein